MGSGNDTYAYSLSYEGAGSRTWISIINQCKEYVLNGLTGGKDPGYRIVEKLFYSLGFSYELYQFLVALLLISALGYIIYRCVENFQDYILSYTFYICFFYHYLPNSATRQTIAIGISIWALIFLTRKKLLWSLVLIVLGSFIHKSIFIVFLAVILYKFTDVRLFFRTSWIYSAGVMVLGLALSKYIVDLFGADQYDVYLNDDGGFYAKHSKPYAFIIQSLLYYILIVFGASSPARVNESPLMKMSYTCYGLAIATVGLILIDPSLIRANAYFSMWGVVMLPRIVECLKLKNLLYIFIFLSLFARIAISPDDYAFKWQEKELHERYFN